MHNKFPKIGRARARRWSIALLCLLASFAPLAAAEAGRPAAGDANRHLQACVNGTAGGFQCSNIDLLENLPLSTFGNAANTNDIWGWTDPLDGSEYTLLGLDIGLAFIDVSEPDHAVYLGLLPTHSIKSLWRSVKVYQNYAFVGSEAAGHGLQIFDLTQLRNVPSPPATFQSAMHYGEFATTHTLEIDTESGFLFAAGTNTCGGGLHIVDIREPLKPAFAGCFGTDGYTHETQCTVYHGPDPDHAGKEICMACNIDTLTILDVTNKSAVSMISRTGYSGNVYAHQGWLTEDHQYFLLDDELDEGSFGHPTKTYIWDVRNLDAPTVIAVHLASTTATDHNQYIRGNYTYQTNYEAGLHILKLDAVAQGVLTEVAFFDTEPGDGDGTWTNYPYFESGIVVVSDIDRGLFILRPNLCEPPVAPTGLAAAAGGPNQIALDWSGTLAPGASFEVERAYGTCPPSGGETVATGLTESALNDAVSAHVDYAYRVRARSADGLCLSEPTACASTRTPSGLCTAPPIFNGLDAAADAGTEACGIDLSWSPAVSRCGGIFMTYAVYRGMDANFTPTPANRLARGLLGHTWRDGSAEPGITYFYVVRATDIGTAAEDNNRLVRTATASGPLGPGTWRAGAEVGDPILESGGATNRHLGWELAGDRAHSGVRSYFSSYLGGVCLAMVTPRIQLLPGGASELGFWSSFGIASGDGGQVQITADGGESWSTLALDGGYPGSFIASADACGFATGAPSFVGQQADFAEWTGSLSSGKNQHSLAAFQGQEVQIRFLFSTDASFGGQGWWLDDLAITDAEVPGVCSAGMLFGDGFESGSTSAWFSATP